MTRLLWYLLALMACVGLASAQVSVPASIEIRDEAASLGFVRALDCVGVNVGCAVSAATGTATVGLVSLTSGVTGTLPVGNGGTGITTLTLNRIPYGNGGSAFQSDADLTFDGTTLTLTGAANPVVLVQASSPAAHLSERIENQSATGYSTLWMGGVNDGFVRGGASAASFAGQLVFLTSGANDVGFVVNNSTRLLVNGTTGTTDILAALTNSGMGAATTGTTVVITGGANEFRPLTSSVRFKENIRSAALDTSAILRGLPGLQRYDYRDVQIVEHVESFNGPPGTRLRTSVGGKNMVGMLAEDVFSVFPDAVNLDAEGRPYSFRFDVMNAALLDAARRHQLQLDNIEMRLRAVEGRAP